MSRTLLVLSILLWWSSSAMAEGTNADAAEIDSARQQELWQQEDFVRAYFVVAEPGGALYSVFGHACLHLVCPAYGLDYFFTYESEGVIHKVLKFLSGRLQMGMCAVTREEYLSGFAEDGRGVVEYEFNLPIDKKRELWRVLDEKVNEGLALPYDFEVRGCAYSCVAMLDEALGDAKIEYGAWSPRFNRTRREMCNDFGKYDYPWNMLFVMALVGADDDNIHSPKEKLIIPTELAEVWQHAKVNGEYLLSLDAHELLPSTTKHKAPWFTPTMAALILLALAILALFVNVPYIDWVVLTVVTLIGGIMTYLVVFSSLPCTDWNWLIIPFNVLPAICWKWRHYWSVPYAAVVICWVVGMLVVQHIIADRSMIITALAFVLILMNRRNNNLKFFDVLSRRI